MGVLIIISQFINRIKIISDNAKLTLSTSLFFAAILSLAFNPFAFSYVIGYLKFDRTMGNATMQGIDASLRIQLFQVFNFAFIPICLILGVLFCYFFTLKINQNELSNNTREALSFLNSVSICALALTVIFILNKYNISVDSGTKEAIKVLLQQCSILALPLIITVATLVYIKHPFVKFEFYRLNIFVSLGLSLFINFLFQRGSELSTVRSLFRFYAIFAVVTIVVLALIKKRKFADFARLGLSFVPLSYGMLFAGVSLEVFNILNQHGIFIVNRLGGAKAVFAVFVLFSVLLFCLANKKFLTGLKSFPHWETISIIGLLLSLYYFTAIPPLQISAGTELFEQANQGLLVNDFLAWGRFPMINSFDAHTLSQSLGMIVYGALNGDLLGASYYGYNFVWLLPAALCAFLIYKNVFDKYFAFFFMLIAPNIASIGVDMGVISIITMLYAVKKQTFRAYFWLFFSIAIGLIYSIPTGFAYGGSTVVIVIIALIIGIVNERKFTTESKAFLKAFGGFAGIMAVLYIGICLKQNLSPIKRAWEFLGVAMSTNNWTYASLGDNTSLTFGLLYSILPIVVIACLIWIVTHFKDKPIYYVTCAFLLAYVMNITRSLQRHSLAENQVGYVIFTAIIGIALFIAAIVPKQKCVVFFVSSLFIITAVFNIGIIQGSGSMASSAIATVNNPAIYYDGATEKTKRVDLSAPLNTYQNVVSMINSVIPAGETYLDLSGQTMLYALSGREKPVYENQSVTQTSGAYSQKRLIEEVEEDYDGICDFALVNTSLWTMNIDDVNGFYRYYYVFEYLYENFRPLCETTDGYTLWVRKSRYDEFSFKEKKEEYTVLPLTIGEANKTNDLTIKSETPLVLKCGVKDPFIILPFASPIEIAPSGGAMYEVELTYKSSASDISQIFFDYAGYNETDSSKSTLSAASDYTVAYFQVATREDLTELKAIRLDPPSGSEFEVKSIRFLRVQSNKADTYGRRIAPVGYDYLGTTHTTSIGHIPYLWGQYDTRKSWNNAVVKSFDSPSGTLDGDVQRDAKYAMITIDSPTSGNADLSFQNSAGENASDFNFTLIAGSNRYIVRCSTDWWWNRDIITSYNVSTDVNATFNGISFLVGD